MYHRYHKTMCEFHSCMHMHIYNLIQVMNINRYSYFYLSKVHTHLYDTIRGQ
jgi:hypothetical protein